MPSTESLPSDIESDNSGSDCLQSSEAEKQHHETKKPMEPVNVKNDMKELVTNIPQLNKVFVVIDKIGSGTFSSVYLAHLKNHSRDLMFALKHVIPTSHPSRIENELRCLLDIGGQDNIIEVKACFREKDHVVIVMPYFAHDKFQDFVSRLQIDEIRLYMRSLLVALRRVHSDDLIHRDIKPSNFLFNRACQRFALVDFGLAQKAPVPLKSETRSSISDKSPANDADLNPLNSCVSGPTTTCKHKMVASSPRKRKLDSLENEMRPYPKIPCLSKFENGTESKADIHSWKTRLPTDSDRKLQTLDQNCLAVPSFMTSTSVFKSTYAKSIKSPQCALLTRKILGTPRLMVGLGKVPIGDRITIDVGQKSSAVKKSSDVDDRVGVAKKSTMVQGECCCYGQPSVCNTCLFRAIQQAPRAGTPGFRAPEVLMKFPGQTTAIDIWSSGIIFLSLLSSRYPFFKAVDDLTSLAQIVSVFGYQEVKAAAAAYGKNLLVSPEPSGFDLRELCEKLRGGDNRSCDRIPDSAYDLLKRLLDLNPFTRITAEDALKHPFFEELCDKEVSTNPKTD